MARTEPAYDSLVEALSRRVVTRRYLALVWGHMSAVSGVIDALVEVHDEPELEIALKIGATLIGVNQRDLKTFEVDHQRAVRMAAQMPGNVIRIAESGVRTQADAKSLRDAGYHAVLVGESLVTAQNIATAVGDLRV